VGQYFRAVNVSKKEFVNPYDLGGLAKLWEWCANRASGIFPYLLRKSNERGGGDISKSDPKYAGRWAGDEIYLVGDYDESDLFEKAGNEFTNISQPLVEEYNDFIEVKELQLKPLRQ
jgi:hypothetical protein